MWYRWRKTRPAGRGAAENREGDSLRPAVSRLLKAWMFCDLIMGGLTQIVLCVGDIGERMPYLKTMNAAVLGLALVWPWMLIGLLYLTRRGIYVFVLEPISVMLPLAWFCLMGGLFATLEGTGKAPFNPWPLGAALFVLASILILVLEWKTGAFLWDECVETGMVDLDEAVVRPQAPRFNVSHLPRWARASLPAGVVAMIVVVFSSVVRISLPGDRSLVVMVAVGWLGAFVIGGVTWAHGIALLWRAVFWEIRSGRKLIVEL